MNANTIFEKFLMELNNVSSFEEKENAMIAAYDEMDECGYSNAEKQHIWNQMMMAA